MKKEKRIEELSTEEVYVALKQTERNLSKLQERMLRIAQVREQIQQAGQTSGKARKEYDKLIGHMEKAYLRAMQEHRTALTLCCLLEDLWLLGQMHSVDGNKSDGQGKKVCGT